MDFSSSSSGTGRDKARGKGSFSQARQRKEEPTEDAETEKREQTLLSECKVYLSGIFVQWEPVCAPAVPPPAQPRHEQVPGCLDGDAAHLLTKWSLRCLLEGSYDGNRTKDFLQWLKRAVMKHRGIVDAVLLDPGLKADLLRLYHQASEAQCDPSTPKRLETAKLFTSIMLHLLETQGPLPALHQQVVSACLPEATCDQARSGKKLLTHFFVSFLGYFFVLTGLQFTENAQTPGQITGSNVIQHYIIGTVKL